MEDNKIRIGITQGDINGVGYEVILKTFSDPTMLELCTPIIYGSPKVAAYHRKALDVQANFSIINSASEAGYNRLSVVQDGDVGLRFGRQLAILLSLASLQGSILLLLGSHFAVALDERFHQGTLVLQKCILSPNLQQ